MTRKLLILGIFALGIITAGCGTSPDQVSTVETVPVSNSEPVVALAQSKAKIAAVEAEKAAFYAAVDEANRQAYFAELARQEQERQEAAAAAAAKQAEAAKKAVKKPAPKSTPKAAAPKAAPSGRSSGLSAAQQCVINHESATSGTYSAENPTSTASGAYQFVDGTWNGYGGYAHASDAPPEVQDQKFAETWANGAGRSHWAGSGC